MTFQSHSKNIHLINNEIIQAISYQTILTHNDFFPRYIFLIEDLNNVASFIEKAPFNVLEHLVNNINPNAIGDYYYHCPNYGDIIYLICLYCPHPQIITHIINKYPHRINYSNNTKKQTPLQALYTNNHLNKTFIISDLEDFLRQNLLNKKRKRIL